MKTGKTNNMLISVVAWILAILALSLVILKLKFL